MNIVNAIKQFEDRFLETYKGSIDEGRKKELVNEYKDKFSVFKLHLKDKTREILGYDN